MSTQIVPNSEQPPQILTSSSRRWHAFPFLAALVLALIMVIVALYGTQYQAPSGSATPSSVNIHILSTLAVPQSALFPGIGLHSIQMLSTDEGWIVGDDERDPSGFYPYILHYHQGKWQQSLIPLVKNGSLDAISMLSSQEGWAAGTYELSTGLSAPLFLHYQNGQWQEVPYSYDKPYGVIEKIQMLSSSDGWAVGSIQSNEEKSGIFHYRDGQWSEEDFSGWLTGIAMVSSTQGWAAGRANQLLHYQDGQWSPWHLPQLGDVVNLQMLSATDGWLAALTPAVGKPHGTMHLWHFDGQQWKMAVTFRLPAHAPSDISLLGTALAMTSAKSGLLTISLGPSEESTHMPDVSNTYNFFFTFDGHQWKQASIAVQGLDLPLSLSSPQEGWAVGNTIYEVKGSNGSFSGGFGSSYILHYTDGTLTLYYQ